MSDQSKSLSIGELLKNKPVLIFLVLLMFGSNGLSIGGISLVKDDALTVEQLNSECQAYVDMQIAGLKKQMKSCLVLIDERLDACEVPPDGGARVRGGESLADLIDEPLPESEELLRILSD